MLMEHGEPQHDLCKLVGRLRYIQSAELPFPPSTRKDTKCLLGLKVEHQKRQPALSAPPLCYSLSHDPLLGLQHLLLGLDGLLLGLKPPPCKEGEPPLSHFSLSQGSSHTQELLKLPVLTFSFCCKTSFFFFLLLVMHFLSMQLYGFVSAFTLRLQVKELRLI